MPSPPKEEIPLNVSTGKDGRKHLGYVWFDSQTWLRPLGDDPTRPDFTHMRPAIEIRLTTTPGTPPWMYLHELRRAFKEIAIELYEGDPCAPDACTCEPEGRTRNT